MAAHSVGVPSLAYLFLEQRESQLINQNQPVQPLQSPAGQELCRVAGPARCGGGQQPPPVKNTSLRFLHDSVLEHPGPWTIQIGYLWWANSSGQEDRHLVPVSTRPLSYNCVILDMVPLPGPLGSFSFLFLVLTLYLEGPGQDP